MSRQTFIYVLKDPRDGTVRYIGRSVNPKVRRHAHLSSVSSVYNHPKHQWLTELFKQGLKPDMEIIDQVDSEQGQAREREWIAHFQKQGANLTNGNCLTDDAVTTVVVSLENTLVDHLRRLARKLAYERDNDITYKDLIREAILKVHPLPE